jgi:hypothetical protein
MSHGREVEGITIINHSDDLRTDVVIVESAPASAEPLTRASFPHGFLRGKVSFDGRQRKRSGVSANLCMHASGGMSQPHRYSYKVPVYCDT